MTRRRTRITAAAGCTVLIAVMAYQTQAQNPSSELFVDPALELSAVQGLPGATSSDATLPLLQLLEGQRRQFAVQRRQSPGAYGISSAGGVIANKTSDAIDKYKEAKSDEDRVAAEKELRAALVERFELLMKQREADLADLKARLERLTAQLQKRRDAKDDIVELRLKVVMNEANGLGFFPDSNQLGRRPRGIINTRNRNR